MEQLKFIFKNRKYFTYFIYLLIIVITFSSGFFIRPYIKITLNKPKPQLSASPTPKPVDRFSRIPVYDRFNLGLKLSDKIVYENDYGIFITNIEGDVHSKWNPTTLSYEVLDCNCTIFS